MWLLGSECDVLDQLADARRTLSPPAEHFGAVARATSADRALAVAGDTAVIVIDGVLLSRPDAWLSLLGISSTTYSDIVAAVEAADHDPRVSKIRLAINSPGGHVAGLYETLEAIAKTTKPRDVVAVQACSAAYVLASVAGAITAASPASTFGSVGVAATYLISDHLVEVASSDAPKKRPDVRTDAGRAIAREHLDAVHAMFADAIAQGRRTTAELVNRDYGRGATLLAEQALSAGMIDGIAASALRPNGAAPGAARSSRSDGDEVADLVEQALGTGAYGSGKRPAVESPPIVERRAPAAPKLDGDTVADLVEQMMGPAT